MYRNNYNHTSLLIKRGILQLCGYDLFDHFTRDSVCPPKYVLTLELGVTNGVNIAYRNWVKTDMALLSLLIATLSDDAMEHVVGCKTSHEAWIALQDRYMVVARASINHLKAELHTIQKGGDSVDKYLLRLKVIKDKLLVAGEKISDNDIVIAALTGLPTEFDMIRTVILARETPITLKEFRAQLLGAEKTLETRMQSLVHTMATMYGNAGSSTFNPMPSSSGSSHASGSAVQFPQTYGYGFVAPGSSTVGFSQSPSFSPPTAFSPQSGFSQTSNGHTFQPQGNNFQSNGDNFGGQGNRSHGNTTSYKGLGSGGFKPKFNGFKSGNVWSGNTSNRQEVIPECQICLKKGVLQSLVCIVMTILNHLRSVKFAVNGVILQLTVDIGETLPIKGLLHLLLSVPIMLIQISVICLSILILCILLHILFLIGFKAILLHSLILQVFHQLLHL